jgi:ferredoxin-NADP reductase
MKLKFIESKQREADARSFIFEPQEPVEWTAGQYTHIVLDHPDADDRGVERWFTVSSAPAEKNIVITTRIDAKRRSTFKEALLKLKPGDEIEAAEPKGKFVFKEEDRNYVWIAGGIGVTPFRSMLTEAAAEGKQPKVHLLWAAQTDEPPYKNDLEALKQKNPNLKIDYFVGDNRLTTDKIKQAIDETDDPMVYVSGPEPMVEALFKDITEKLGFDKENLKTDYFPGYEAF